MLEKDGWSVTKVSGFGNARIRRIVKDGKSKLAAIRTTQDQWLAFPRTKDDTQWATLSDVDVVVVASLDPDDPQFARIHVIDADELQGRFDRAYAARRAANHIIPSGRGVWIALYQNEASDPVTLVGAGAGIANAPIARVPLTAVAMPATDSPATAQAATAQAATAGAPEERALTIAEAKAGLARSFGVDPSSIKITVEA
ncbi:MAG: hypothetical protein OXG04_16450 [Acidobacteria bacterium]|nr:hypothetical protein [Acidobacteriota bacterium]